MEQEKNSNKKLLVRLDTKVQPDLEHNDRTKSFHENTLKGMTKEEKINFLRNENKELMTYIKNQPSLDELKETISSLTKQNEFLEKNNQILQETNHYIKKTNNLQEIRIEFLEKKLNLK